jgi:excisionase family DNA binding protein
MQPIQVQIALDPEHLDKVLKEAMLEKLQAWKPDPWMTPDEAAEYMRLKPDTVRTLIRSSKLDHGLRGTRDYVVKQSACDDYLQRHKRKGQPR